MAKEYVTQWKVNDVAALLEGIGEEVTTTEGGLGSFDGAGIRVKIDGDEIWITPFRTTKGFHPDPRPWDDFEYDYIEIKSFSADCSGDVQGSPEVCYVGAQVKQKLREAGYCNFIRHYDQIF